MDPIKPMLLLGGLLNILSGIIAIALPDSFKLLDNRFDPMCNPLIGLFVGGVIAAFGCGYLYTFFWEPRNLSLLALGISVRLWLVIVSTYCYVAKEISTKLYSLVAIDALFFAIVFALYIYQRRKVLTWT
jgi:hypothetical protein